MKKKNSEITSLLWRAASCPSLETQSLVILLLPSLHIAVPIPDRRARSELVFGVLRNRVVGPEYFSPQHGCLVPSCDVTILGDKCIFGSRIIDVCEAFSASFSCSSPVLSTAQSQLYHSQLE